MAAEEYGEGDLPTPEKILDFSFENGVFSFIQRDICTTFIAVYATKYSGYIGCEL